MFCRFETIINVTMVLERSAGVRDMTADQATPGALIVVGSSRVERLHPNGTFELLVGQETTG